MKKVIFVMLLILSACGTILASVPSENLTTNKASSVTQLSPSLTLLGAGARWAGSNGSSALYVDWYDNVIAHPNPYAPDLSVLQQDHAEISDVLEQYGFNVTLAADIPDNISGYDILVIDSYWACEPAKEPIVRDFISSGGGVVLIAAVPRYLATYCKDMWPGYDLSPVQDWFGASTYDNAGGYAKVVVNNSFGSSLSAGDSVGLFQGDSFAAVRYSLNDSTVIAQWENGYVFSLAHEYGQGRVYYQAAMSDLTPPEITSINISPSEPTSNDTVKVDVSISEPENAGGLIRVLFSFDDSFGQQWNTTMTYEEANNLWEVIIPRQPSGTNVQFFILAFDNAGNQAVKGYNYTVT